MKTQTETERIVGSSEQSPSVARLRIELNGRQVQVDDELAELLVSLIISQKLLTSQQAADLLQVSRPTLITLLDRHEIPVTMVGKHRRIKAQHLALLKQKIEVEQESAFDQLIALSEELGLYSTDHPVSNPNDNS